MCSCLYPILTMTVPPALNILIVDDNAICAHILARIFKLKKLEEIITYEITIRSSSEDALPDLEKTRYHIIFTDIEMGKISGCSMVETIRDKSTDIYIENRDTPIIAVTSRYDASFCAQYKKAGITKCLEKPAKSNAVYDIIKARVEELTTSI
jgi:CheY-like chemotaxis protein